MNNSPGWTWPAITTSNSAYGNFPMYKKSSTQLTNNNDDGDDNLPSTGRSTDSGTINNNSSENKLAMSTLNPPEQQQQQSSTMATNNNNCDSKSEPAVVNEHPVNINVSQQQQQQQQCQVGSGESGQPKLTQKVQLDNVPDVSTLKISQDESQSQTDSKNKKNSSEKKVAFEKSSMDNDGKQQQQQQQQQRFLYRSKSQGGIKSKKNFPNSHSHRHHHHQHFEASPQYQQSQLATTPNPQVIKGNPSAPQINVQPRLNLRRMMTTNKPKFHLCGKCTKCKIIQGSPDPSSSLSSTLSVTTVNFQKKNQTSSSSSERGYSTTIFPR